MPVDARGVMRLPPGGWLGAGGLSLICAWLLASPARTEGAVGSTDDLLAEVNRELADFDGAASLDRSIFLLAAEFDRIAFEREVEALWGEFVPNDRYTWSSYDSGRLRHGLVDFRRGEVTVQVLVRGTLPPPVGAVAAGLGEQLTAMMSPSSSQLGRNPLTGLIDRGGGLPLEPGDVPSVVSGKVERGEVTHRVLPGPTGAERTVISLRFPMVPDHLIRAARPYRQLVREFSRRFALDPALVLAVIHTESFFNPFARSAANAHGLMQLVPHMGASDAWRHTRGTPRVVTPEELYQPRLNIELGTAYLRVLLDEFAGLRDPASKVLAAVAAYNCGPGNTRKALAGSGAGGALPPAARIRAALLGRTPAETRDYVRLVTERRRFWRESAGESIP